MSRALDLGRALLRGLYVVLGALALTLCFFLVLPLMQSIAKPPEIDLVVQSIDTAEVPPPPPPPESEPEKEPAPEDAPPELVDSAPPLDLAQLELALNPGFGDGWMGADFVVKLSPLTAVNSTDVEALFALSDLDQKPRVLYQPSPILDAAARKKAPGKVHILFVVDTRGRVENPIIQQSSDPVFEGPALAAVRQWKFEPGKRNGQAVRFRMRVPITFPKG